MKKYTFLQVMLLAILLIAGCKKNSNDKTSDNTVLSDEFISVYLLSGKDWRFVQNNSPSASTSWSQGFIDSKSFPSGFDAWSYKNSTDEYAYINGYFPYAPGTADISAWMITNPVLIKNGDKIQFYARSSFVQGSINRLQLLLNETGSSFDVGNTPVSVGGFTKVLLDINQNLLPDAFPVVWTPYIVEVTGLNNALITRLAFRYVVDGLKASGIGVDALTIIRK